MSDPIRKKLDKRQRATYNLVFSTVLWSLLISAGLVGLVVIPALLPLGAAAAMILGTLIFTASMGAHFASGLGLYKAAGFLEKLMTGMNLREYDKLNNDFKNHENDFYLETEELSKAGKSKQASFRIKAAMEIIDNKKEVKPKIVNKFAKLAGKQYVRDIENGKIPEITVKEIQKIYQKLDLEINDFYKNAHHALEKQKLKLEEGVKQESSSILSKIGNGFLNLFRTSKQEKLDQIKKLIENHNKFYKPEVKTEMRPVLKFENKEQKNETKKTGELVYDRFLAKSEKYKRELDNMQKENEEFEQEIEKALRESGFYKNKKIN